MNTEHKSNTPTEIRDLWKTPKFVFDPNSPFKSQVCLLERDEIMKK